MTDKLFQVIFRTLNEGEGARDFKKTTMEINDVLKGMTGINLKNVLSLAGMGVVLSKVVQAADKAKNKFMDYAGAVQDVSLKTGMTYEESSRLLQVMGDMEIETAAFTTVMEQAQKKGFNPSIENLAKLADEYNALNDPLARANLLTDTLGKSGADLTKFFQNSGSQIMGMAGAVQQELVLTEKQIEARQELIDATDDTQDAMDGLELSYGETITNFATSIEGAKQEGLKFLDGASKWAADVINGNDETIAEFAGIALDSSKTNAEYIKNLKTAAISAGGLEGRQLNFMAKAAEDAGTLGFAALKGWENVTKLKALVDSGAFKPGAITATTEAVEQLAEASTATAEFAIKGKLTDALDTSNEKMTELREEHEAITAEMGKTSTWTDAYDDLQGKLEDNEQAQKDLKISLQQTTKELIFQQAAAGLDAKAALTLAREMGLLDEANYDVGMAIQDARDIYAQTGDEEAYAEQIERINTAWRTYMELPDYERKVIQFDEYYNKYYGSGYIPNSTYMGGSPTGNKYYADEEAYDGATGLNMTVPAGFPNDSYGMKLNVSSGERVQVLTKEQQASGAGTSIYGDIYITAQNGDTLDDLMAQVQRARG